MVEEASTPQEFSIRYVKSWYCECQLNEPYIFNEKSPVYSMKRVLYIRWKASNHDSAWSWYASMCHAVQEFEFWVSWDLTLTLVLVLKAHSHCIWTYCYCMLTSHGELSFPNRDWILHQQASDWLMIALIIWNSTLVPLLEVLCSSNTYRFEFSGFGVFAEIEPTTQASGLTVLHSDQLS